MRQPPSWLPELRDPGHAPYVRWAERR